MPIKPFIKANTDDISLTILQNGLESTLNSIVAIPFLNGTQLKNITLVANQDTVIAHGLNKQYQGWFPTNQNNFGKLKVSDTKNNAPQTKIILVSEANLVADIWIY